MDIIEMRASIRTARAKVNEVRDAVNKVDVGGGDMATINIVNSLGTFLNGAEDNLVETSRMLGEWIELGLERQGCL